MKVILLEDVKALGKKGQVVNVSDGYARNLLLPKKLGVEATGKNMNDLKLHQISLQVRYKPVRLHHFPEFLLRNQHLYRQKYYIPYLLLHLW